jgi:cytochrome d ubiquinol oxidase subunit II
MQTIWFILLAFLITGYVLLDGFDLGAGIIHLITARNPEERRQILASIGPVWDGNEVWLIAAGGTLFFAFPTLYASSFAGFYLPLMIVLWLLILRGIAIEFRNHVASPVWTPLWDAVFSVSSALLAIFFGAALGNVIRGVPLDSQQEFFLPLWTDFRLRGEVGILDPYTILAGLTAAAALTMHGALWVSLKTSGNLSVRATSMARRAAIPTAVLIGALTVFSFQIQPQIAANFTSHPWGLIFPAAAVFGLAGAWFFTQLRAFLASCLFLAGLLASAAFGIYPYVLPSSDNPAAGLTIHNSAAAQSGLTIGLYWWIPGMLLATAYTVFVYRRFTGKVAA